MANPVCRPIRAAVVAALASTFAAAALAQPGPGGGPGPGPGASAPRGGMMMGPGPSASAPRGAMMRGGRYGAGITPGWTMMTAEERAAHRTAMQGMTSYDECRAYADKHHQEMVERAKQRGAAMPAQPRRDVCDGLKK